ncbi:MAG TPA: GNAT family N-acetyltransferase [Solirubrobacterales bacterium]
MEGLENRQTKSPTSASGEAGVRRASVDDAPEIAQLLHDFNTEFSDPTPGTAVLTDRARQLLTDEEITVLLSSEPSVGLALLRFRPSLWDETLEAYLEELYVAPSRRGEGIGRALMETSMEVAREAGAAYMSLCTGETDTAARGLYESCEFTNLERLPDGPRMLFYERDL